MLISSCKSHGATGGWGLKELQMHGRLGDGGGRDARGAGEGRREVWRDVEAAGRGVCDLIIVLFVVAVLYI